MNKTKPKFRWTVSSQEREQIRELTLRHTSQTVIARTLGIAAACVSQTQRAMNLPTRLAKPPIPEDAIMKLFREGWGGYRIAKHLRVPVNQVYRIAHKNNFRRPDAVGYPTNPQAEAQLIEALKRRDDYAIRLARKYKVGICKTKRLAHEVLETREFRPGACKPALSSAYPQKFFDKVGGQK